MLCEGKQWHLRTVFPSGANDGITNCGLFPAMTLLLYVDVGMYGALDFSFKLVCSGIL